MIGETGGPPFPSLGRRPYDHDLRLITRGITEKGNTKLEPDFGGGSWVCRDASWCRSGPWFDPTVSWARVSDSSKHGAGFCYASAFLRRTFSSPIRRSAA